MSGLLVLIPIALFLAIMGLIAFLWSLRSGQFEDLQGAAHRILNDEERPLPDSKSELKSHDGKKDAAGRR